MGGAGAVKAGARAEAAAATIGTVSKEADTQHETKSVAVGKTDGVE